MSNPVPTTCVRCAVGCGHVHRGADTGAGLEEVRGDPAHPVNRGLACSRGISETADPDGEWLTRPLVREDGDLIATTWDHALRVATEGFRDVVADDPDALAVLGSGQQTTEAAYALGKVARGGIGTRNYDANTTLCMSSAVTAYDDAFGSDAPPPTYDDIPTAETHVVWGANPAVAHPVMFRWIAEAAREGGRLIVVDPVETRSADVADEHVTPAPGGDLALARAVLARLVERGDVDEDFVRSHTDGFAAAVDGLPDVEAAADAAGVAVEAVDALATAFADRTLVYWGMGVNQSVRGTATAGALIDLCLATGNMGPGCGPFSLTGQANSMGTRVCSSKGGWPGRRPFDDPTARREIASAWGVDVETLPDDTGPGPVELFAADPDAVWTVATNPAAGMPDAARVRDVLSDAFVVTQDAFRTETVGLADVVLPAATWGETEGTVINMERTVSRVRAATEKPPGVKTDLELIATLGEALSPGLFGTTTPDPGEIFEEFAALTAGTTADCSGLSYDRLDAEHAVRWPAPDAVSAGGYRYLDGARRIGSDQSTYVDGGGETTDAATGDDGTTVDSLPDDPADWSWSFPTPTGRARFSRAARRGRGVTVGTTLPEAPDDDFPLTLTTGRERDGYNTGIRSRDLDAGPVTARVHPETLAAHDGAVSDGETVVATRRAAVDARVEADPAVPAGTVWLPIHHPRTNDLTSPATDPRSAEPNFKQCAACLVAPSSRTDGTDREEMPA